MKEYRLETICKCNTARSPMLKAVMDDMLSKNGNQIEGVPVRIGSSGTIVDDVKNWLTGQEFKWDTVLKVLKVAYNNGIHEMTGYKGFVEQVMADESKAKQNHDKDPVYRKEINLAAAHLYQLVERLDLASTMTVLATNGLSYPYGGPRQFVPNQSSLYVPMEAELAEKVEKKVRQAGEEGKVICFEGFIGKEMKGSLGAIKYLDDKLDIAGHAQIFETIKNGCDKLIDFMQADMQK